MKKILNLGLIGFGPWGQNIAKTINKNIKNVFLKSIYTRKLKKFNINFGKNVNLYNDWSLMLKKEQLDLVILAMPPKLNLKILTIILKKRIPVLIEKPLAINLPDAKKIFQLCKLNNSITDVNYIDLSNNAVKKLISMKPKNIKFIKAKITSSFKGRPDSDFTPLWDYASHFIPVILKIFRKKPLAIKCEALSINKSLPNLKRKRHLYKIELFFKNNLKALIVAGNGTLKKNRKMEVQTTSLAKFIYNDQNDNSLIYQGQNKSKKVLYKKKMKFPLTNSIKSFLNKVKNNKKNYEGIKLGLDVTKILSSAEKSLKKPKKNNLIYIK